MKITPWIVGTGRSGQAIAKSIAALAITDPELGLEPARTLSRADVDQIGFRLREIENPVLYIANPHGLHARLIHRAVEQGIRNIVCEKPVAVSLDEVRTLRGLDASIAVLHVFRLMWGPGMLRQMLVCGELGDVIAIEGRYWQASAAARAVEEVDPRARQDWKSDPALSGPYDAYLDVATHWVDLVSFLCGSAPERVRAWLARRNGAAPHRDTHVQLSMLYSQRNRGGPVRAMGSISKTVHGASNHFEINVIGTRKAATWLFERPDEIFIGEGRDRAVRVRRQVETGSRQGPFHGTGWLEGYIEVSRQALGEMFLRRPGVFPRLDESLDTIEKLLTAEIESCD